MSIEAFDPNDERMLRDSYAVLEASLSVGRPWHESPPFEGWRQEMQHQDPKSLQEGVVCRVDGQVVGACLWWGSHSDNVEQLWMQLEVHPEHRRKGCGTELLAASRECSQSLGRTERIFEPRVPAGGGVGAGEAFGRRHGMTFGWRDETRMLDLPAPEDRLAALGEQAAQRWRSAYELRTFVTAA